MARPLGYSRAIAALVLSIGLLMPRAAAAESTGDRPASDSTDQRARSALPLLADTDNGRSLFDRHCRRCHGANAYGDADLGYPVLAGQRFAYLVRQLAAFAVETRDSPTMHRSMLPPTVRTPQAWVDIAAYVTALPPPRFNRVGDGERTNAGRIMFHERCALCHGDDARGDDDHFVPSLRNQHYPYLVSQIVGLAEDHRHNVDRELVRYLQELNGRDIEVLADYLSRLRAGADPAGSSAHDRR